MSPGFFATSQVMHCEKVVTSLNEVCWVRDLHFFTQKSFVDDTRFSLLSWCFQLGKLKMAFRFPGWAIEPTTGWKQCGVGVNHTEHEAVVNERRRTAVGDAAWNAPLEP